MPMCKSEPIFSTCQYQYHKCVYILIVEAAEDNRTSDYFRVFILEPK